MLRTGWRPLTRPVASSRGDADEAAEVGQAAAPHGAGAADRSVLAAVPDLGGAPAGHRQRRRGWQLLGGGIDANSPRSSRRAAARGTWPGRRPDQVAEVRDRPAGVPAEPAAEPEPARPYPPLRLAGRAGDHDRGLGGARLAGRRPGPAAGSADDHNRATHFRGQPARAADGHGPEG